MIVWGGHGPRHRASRSCAMTNLTNLTNPNASPTDHAAYDDIAEWYDAWIGPHAMRDDPFFPAVEELMGDVAGRDICDLACGQGRVARHLAALGARVTAVDLSRRLLAI